MKLRGTWPGGQTRKTSPLVERLGPAAVRTFTGGEYGLVGPPVGGDVASLDDVAFVPPPDNLTGRLLARRAI